MTDLVEVGRFKTLADARQQVLVLAAVGIECHLMGADRDVGLYVAATEVEQAMEELACYERENLPSGPRPLPARPVRHGSDRGRGKLGRRSDPPSAVDLPLPDCGLTDQIAPP
jgi:hypothetical protein